MTMEIDTLGRLGARVDGREVPGLLSRPVRTALLVYLAVEREITRDAAMALLWPESDTRRARHALSQTLYELRSALGEDWVAVSGERLRLGDGVSIDVTRMERAVAERQYAEALRCNAGPFLEGWHLMASVPFEEWVERQRVRLARLFADACGKRVAHCRALGDLPSALEVARAWALREPLDGDAQHLLLNLLLESGDANGALRQYREFERRLRDEDLVPLPETLEILRRIRQRLAAATHVTARLAVLPFDHVGPEEDRYFTEGVTQELTEELMRLPELAVIARSSAVRADAAQPLTSIGRELGVGYVLRGAARWDRGAGRLRLSPRLMRVADATELWGDSYEAELAGAAAVAAVVAERVREALSGPGPHPHVGARPAAHQGGPEAYELYLKGVHYAQHRTEQSLRTAAELFQAALAIEPDYARAYAGLAQVYAVFPGFTGAQPREWYPKARAAAEQALALDGDLAEAHAALAFAVFHLEWDLATAELHLRRCLELAPSYAQAWVRLGYILCTRGRFEEARDAAERALTLDPLSVATNFDTGFHFWQLHDRERAVRQFRRVEELDPEFMPAHYFLGADGFVRGELDLARREWSRLGQLGPLWQSVVAAIDLPEAAVPAIERWTRFAPGPVHYYLVAATYTLLGARERALDWLEAHYRNVRGEPGRLQTGGPSLTHIVRDPIFDPLREAPRFRDLLRAMGLQPGTAAPALTATALSDSALIDAESRMM